MAIVLIGAAPTEEVGERFHMSEWSWRPLRMICEQVLEDVLPWGTNDASLDEEGVKDLSNKLAGFLGDNNDFEFTHTVDGKMFMVERDQIEAFIDFLRACGGFESE